MPAPLALAEEKEEVAEEEVKAEEVDAVAPPSPRSLGGEVQCGKS